MRDQYIVYGRINKRGKEYFIVFDSVAQRGVIGKGNYGNEAAAKAEAERLNAIVRARMPAPLERGEHGNKNGVLKPFRKVIHPVAMEAPKVANVPNVHKIDDRDAVKDIDRDLSPKAINQRINSYKNKKDLDDLLDNLDALGCDYDFLDDKINKKIP